MNVGFSNLDTLKKKILSGSFSSDKRFDDLIAALGLGVAGMFEKYCGRGFMRTVNAQQIFSADRCEFSVNRFPLEVVTLSEFKKTEAEGWVAQDGTFIRIIDYASGIIDCGSVDIGKSWEQVRFTFTGGYFWETLEPDDPAHPSIMPATATKLPDSLFLAWLLQCKHIWGLQDKIGTDILKDGSAKSLRFPEDYAVTVKDTLELFVHYNLV